jgi:hypothetical protein
LTPTINARSEYRIRVGYCEDYSIIVDSSAGLKFVAVRTHENGIATKSDRREFFTPQDAISDLLDVIAEWSVSQE